LGVVVARPGYPYTAAHGRAEALLGRAKGLSREALKRGVFVSALAFEVVYGADRPGAHAPGASGCRPGIQPLFAGAYAMDLLSTPDNRVVPLSLHVRTFMEAQPRLLSLPR